MFSGIIEEVAPLESLFRKAGVYQIKVRSKIISPSSKEGESVALDGVCLTLTKKNKDTLMFDIIEPTFKNTRFKYLRLGEKVNLERALKFGASLSGHLVSGHIDSVLEVYKVENKNGTKNIVLKIPPQFRAFVINKGSIALNGVSLTIQEVKNGLAIVSLIPYTRNSTNLDNLKSYSRVNVEFDIFAKYIFNYLKNASG